jgi:hypothetical protein
MQRRVFPGHTTEGKDPFQTFTEQEDINVVKVSEYASGTMVYFELKAHLLTEEITNLSRVKNSASRIEGDVPFSKLTNKRQRELYLLEQYSLNSADAGDVIEYLAMKKKVNEE